MCRSKFFKATRTARHSFSAVEKFVSLCNNFFAKYAIGCSRPNSICWVSAAPQQNCEKSPFKEMEHSDLVAAKWINLSMPFEGHQMHQAQQLSFEIYQVYVICKFSERKCSLTLIFNVSTVITIDPKNSKMISSKCKPGNLQWLWPCQGQEQFCHFPPQILST